MLAQRHGRDFRAIRSRTCTRTGARRHADRGPVPPGRPWATVGPHRPMIQAQPPSPRRLRPRRRDRRCPGPIPAPWPSAAGRFRGLCRGLRRSPGASARGRSADRHAQRPRGAAAGRRPRRAAGRRRAVEVARGRGPRDELLLVHATGPRGDQARRTRTRQTHVAVSAAPYQVRGYLHARPFLDALPACIGAADGAADRRGHRATRIGGEWQRHRVGSLDVNRGGIDHIIETPEHDISDHRSQYPASWMPRWPTGRAARSLAPDPRGHALVAGPRRYHRRDVRRARPDPGPLAGHPGRRPARRSWPGPTRTMVLADLGADVVKVEPPEGDATRGWGPPWVGDGAGGTRTAGVLPRRQPQQALAPARPRRRPTGADVLRRLVADARRPHREPARWRSTGSASTTRRSRALNPELVHLSISGYGPTGPAAGRPGYDFVIQAVGGLMSITGDADARRRPSDQGRASRSATSSPGSSRRSASWPACSPRRRRRTAGRPAGRRLAPGSTLAVLVNQAQNAFVDRPLTGPARQRPPEHRPVRDVRDGRRRARGGGRLGATVAAVLRGDRAPGARRRRALRDQRRAGGQPRRAASAARRAARRPPDGRLDGRAREAEVPVRRGRRRPRRVRFARGRARSG